LVDDSSDVSEDVFPSGIILRKVTFNNVCKSWNLVCKMAFYDLFEEYAIITNNDVEFLEGSLQALTEFLFKHPEYDFVTASEVRDGQVVEGYTFSHFALSKQLYEKVGVFDENLLGPTLEDWDYLARMADLGIPVVRCPTWLVHHHRSATKRLLESDPHIQKRVKKTEEYYREKWKGSGHKLP